MITLQFGAEDRAKVRDAALPIQLLRTQIARDLTRGSAPDVEWMQLPAPDAIQWIMDQCLASRELHAVSHYVAGSVEAYRKNLECNRELVRRGVRMLSLFDVSDLAHDIADYLISCEDMPYYFSYGPMPIKIFDGRQVMLEAPRTPGKTSIMLVSRPDVVAAAQGYVAAVRKCAVASSTLATATVDGLTPRQHTVAQLMGESLTDDAIAALLGVSVRTIRAEVATLMRTVGATTRFAAGIKYAQNQAAE